MPHNERKQAEPTQTSPERPKSRRRPLNDSGEIKPEHIKKLQVDTSKELRTFWKKLQKTRYKTIQTSKGIYRSDRWIWQGSLILIFFWLWFIAHSYHYNLDYFKCGDGERLYEGPHQVCPNPFYNPSLAWKTEPYLPYGEYGQKPGPLFNSAGYVAFGILILAGLLNHIAHNTRRTRT